MFVSEVGDHEGDVFFKLTKVESDVVLVEQGVFVVLHVLRNVQEEMRFLEEIHHLPDVVTDQSHLLFNLLNLAFLSLSLLLDVYDILVEVAPHSHLLFLSHLSEFLVSPDLLLNIPVLLLDHVNLGIEHVDVVV